MCENEYSLELFLRRISNATLTAHVTIQSAGENILARLKQSA